MQTLQIGCKAEVAVGRAQGGSVQPQT